MMCLSSETGGREAGQGCGAGREAGQAQAQARAQARAGRGPLPPEVGAGGWRLAVGGWRGGGQGQRHRHDMGGGMRTMRAYPRCIPKIPYSPSSLAFRHHAPGVTRATPAHFRSRCPLAPLCPDPKRPAFLTVALGTCTYLSLPERGRLVRAEERPLMGVDRLFLGFCAMCVCRTVPHCVML